MNKYTNEQKQNVIGRYANENLFRILSPIVRYLAAQSILG